MTAHHFTLSLSVPPDARIKVALNHTIKAGDIIAVKPAPHVEFNLSQKLKLKPPKIEKLLQKKVGDPVQKGEVLVEKKTIFSAHKIVSHVSGTVSSYQQGTIYLQLNEPDIEISSPVSGQVKHIEGNIISVKTPVEPQTVHWSWGSMVWGKLKTLGDRESPPEIETIKGDYTGDILVISGKLSKALWHKLITLGAAGFICSQVPDDFEQWSLGADPALAGQAIAVIDNGKTSTFAKEVWKWFNDRVGQIAILNGEEGKIFMAK